MTDHPKPGPREVAPIRELPVKGAGVNDDVIEMRSRLLFGLIRHGVTDRDDLIDLMDRMELGPGFDDEGDDDD